jgi:cellulose synthase/poly-beta-1,6-N-acetylglucosamine synthase-like glycosyltransferase
MLTIVLLTTKLTQNSTSNMLKLSNFFNSVKAFPKTLNFSKTYIVLAVVFASGLVFSTLSILKIISPSIYSFLLPVAAFVIVSIKLIDLIFGSIIVYNLVISLFGFGGKSYPVKNGRFIIPAPENGKFNNFALVICAHNEKNVIQNTLEEMQKLDYPSDKLKIVVVCDNCKDDTANLARQVKSDKFETIILERSSTTQKGKPYAVKFAFDYLDDNNIEYQAISIADADNLYHPDFFLVMNAKVNSGSNVIQGYLGVKNPEDSHISASSMFAYASASRAFFVARQNLGMSTALGGTGFVLTKSILQKVPWNLTSLVEDFEYSVKCLLQDELVDFAYEAITYDEKPNDLTTSMTQRSRWMQGHWFVCFTNTIPLLKKIFTTGFRNKLSQIDYMIYLWSPGRIIMHSWLLLSFLFLLPFYLSSPDLRGLVWYDLFARFAYVFFPLLLNYIYAVKEGFRWSSLVSLFYYYFVYGFSYYPITIRAMMNWKKQSVWIKTEHSVVTKASSINIKGTESHAQ